MKKLKGIISISLISMLVFTGCLKTEKTEAGKSKEVVATIYGENITKGEFDESFAPILKSVEHMYKKQADADAATKKEGKKVDTKAEGRLPENKDNHIKEQKEMHLQEVANQKIYEYQAKKNKINVTDEEVNKQVKEQIDAWIKQYETKEKLTEEIKNSTGLTYEEYEKFLKKSMKMNLIATKVQEITVKDVKVTDEEAKKEYDENPYGYTEEPNKLIFSHILVNDEKTAKEVKTKLDGGAKIADLAKEYSQDPGSKDKGGKYEEGLDYAGLDPAFLEAALKQEIDKPGEPVKGQPRDGKDSYYIIQVHEKKEFPAKKFEDVKEEIKQGLLQQKQMTVMQEKSTAWTQEAKIKTYPGKL